MRLRPVQAALFFIALGICAATPPASEAGVATIEYREVFPNPFTEFCDFELTMPNFGVVRVNVYDVRGQFIKTLLDGEVPQGQRLVRWDGTDERGIEVPPGIYIGVLWENGRVLSSAKVVKKMKSLS
jgi:hypothetical protein